MVFKKAVAASIPFKATFYGPPKSGKTLTSLVMAEGLIAATCPGKRIAYVDTEQGTKTYARDNPHRAVHPKGFDFDALYTRSMSLVLSDLRALKPDAYGVIVIDSISHLWDSVREAWEAKNPGKEIALRDWGSVKRPYKDLMKFLIDCPMHVFILGRQKNVFDEDENGKLSKTGVAMRAEGETQYEPDTIFRFETLYPDGERGNTEGTIRCFCEGDRYSVLTGKWFANPSFDTLRPLVPFLGTEAPITEDDEERALADGELLRDGEDKAKAKEAKSSGLLAKYQAEIASCASVADLGAFADRLKKDKRYIIEEHLSALKVLYDEKRHRVVEAAAPEAV